MLQDAKNYETRSKFVKIMPRKCRFFPWRLTRLWLYKILRLCYEETKSACHLLGIASYRTIAVLFLRRRLVQKYYTHGRPVVDHIRWHVGRVAVSTQSAHVMLHKLGTGTLSGGVGCHRNGADQSHEKPDRNHHALWRHCHVILIGVTCVLREIHTIICILLIHERRHNIRPSSTQSKDYAYPLGSSNLKRTLRGLWGSCAVH